MLCIDIAWKHYLPSPLHPSVIFDNIVHVTRDQFIPALSDDSVITIHKSIYLYRPGNALLIDSKSMLRVHANALKKNSVVRYDMNNVLLQYGKVIGLFAAAYMMKVFNNLLCFTSWNTIIVKHGTIQSTDLNVMV